MGLYNSNMAESLNLASTLYDVNAVDVSDGVAETEGASVSTGIVSGEQGVSSQSGETGSVDWGRGGEGELDPQVWTGYGTIYFQGGNWGQSVPVSMSLTSDGTGSNTTTQHIDRLGALYSGMSATVRGGAKLASGWDRIWYGDQEYAYTYFSRMLDTVVGMPASAGMWTCSPNFWKSGSYVYLSAADPFFVNDSWSYDTAAARHSGVALMRPRLGRQINASATCRSRGARLQTIRSQSLYGQ